jgi:hypothetical protein
MHHLASIYQAGVDFAANKPEDLLRIQQSLDQVTAMIYARTGMELNEAYSATLLVQTEEEESGQMLPPPENELMINAPAPMAEAAADPVLQPDLNRLKPFALEPALAAENAEASPMQEEAKPIPA